MAGKKEAVLSVELQINKATATRIVDNLGQIHPKAKCALIHENPLQLLVATILSAQCTDIRVNIVTKELFKKFPDAQAFADCDIEELQEAIRSTGFFRNKAANIKKACQLIVSKFSGQIPSTMEELLELPGVARKTANVVLGSGFGIASGFVVDTHVARLSQRLAFTRNTDPEKIEKDIIALVEKEHWIDFANQLVWHGREVCGSRNPACSKCGLAQDCVTFTEDSKK